MSHESSAAHDRRRLGRPREGDERPCAVCGGTMRFIERARLGGSLIEEQPVWICRCGIERLVRTEVDQRVPADGVLPSAAQLKIASLRELRRTLADWRTRAKEQRVRAVTLRERAHAALAAAQQQLVISAIALDDGARHLAANRCACVLTGYTEGELASMNLRSLRGEDWTSRTEREWRQFLSRGQLTGMCLLRRKTGAVVTVRYAAATHVLPGVHVAALAPRDRMANSV